MGMSLAQAAAAIAAARHGQTSGARTRRAATFAKFKPKKQTASLSAQLTRMRSTGAFTR